MAVTGGFGADIEDMCAVGFKGQGLIQGGGGIEELSAVGKRIGREIENAHEDRRAGGGTGRGRRWNAGLIHPRRKAVGV